ncbi:MAG TPA: hypothetical protein VGG56_07570 [Terracidiphilus sp.]|jgi:hypothetical protein
MRISSYRFRKQIAGFLVLLLAMPLAETAAAQSQQTLSSQQAQRAPADPTQPQNPASADQTAQPGTAQPNPEPQQNSPTKPVGTAAAPLENTSGVAASRPAGAAIAPAKQRRARAILIRVSIVVGAAIAVGTVVGLSRSSPSRPN